MMTMADAIGNPDIVGKGGGGLGTLSAIRHVVGDDGG